MSELYFQPVCQDDYKEIMALEYASFNGRDRMKPEVFYDFITSPVKPRPLGRRYKGQKM